MPTPGAPADYAAIITGDLGKIGHEILTDLFLRDGVDLGVCSTDCGMLIFNPETQDVHAGGSGCGCSASVLCGHILQRMTCGDWPRVLFAATGALMSPTTSQQGESIPASVMPWCWMLIGVKTMWTDYLKAFLVGGALCALGQVLIDRTKLTPARILTCYVVLGVVLHAVGVYAPLIEWAGAGASVPLTGFGSTLAKGVEKAVAEKGFLGAFTGGLTASAGGIAAAIFFGYLAAVLFKPKEKNDSPISPLSAQNGGEQHGHHAAAAAVKGQRFVLRQRFLRRFKQKDRAAGRFGRIGFQRSVLRERHAQHDGGAAVPGRRARLLQIIRSGGKSRNADVPVLRGAQDIGMARVAAAERAREIYAPFSRNATGSRAAAS